MAWHVAVERHEDHGMRSPLGYWEICLGLVTAFAPFTELESVVSQESRVWKKVQFEREMSCTLSR